MRIRARYGTRSVVTFRSFVQSIERPGKVRYRTRDNLHDERHLVEPALEIATGLPLQREARGP
jgi:hypothetical protein